jgi:amino acid transporter
MAANGMLPRVVAKKTRQTPTGGGVPWVSLLCCTVAWSLCLGFNFDKLIELDVTIYGLSLVLEFAALVVLRLRAPEMARPFRIPGGVGAAIALGAAPTALILYAIFASRHDQIGSIPAIWVGGGVVLAGPLVWLAMLASRMMRLKPDPPSAS